jgi:hypothetical protein
MDDKLDRVKKLQELAAYRYDAARKAVARGDYELAIKIQQAAASTYVDAIETDEEYIERKAERKRKSEFDYRMKHCLSPDEQFERKVHAILTWRYGIPNLRTAEGIIIAVAMVLYASIILAGVAAITGKYVGDPNYCDVHACVMDD